MYSDITLVIPAKNESESLPSVLEELKKFKIKKHIILEKRDKKLLKVLKILIVKLFYKKIKVTVTL